ncbi:MAG TPA: hypothetical protein VKJ65_00220 [Phycisphaerae bacterium]|nr:hypothetical protein [Phycisphaerae bacterium]
MFNKKNAAIDALHQICLSVATHQLVNQIIAVLFTVGFAGIATLVLFKTVDALIGLRVDVEDESLGLDLTQHGERAYSE